MAQRVLIVDDEEAARYSLHRALENHGYDLKLAASAREALAVQDSFQPDLVVTDINMPGMSGLAFIRELRSRSLPPPVIVITGHASQELAIESLRHGALDFLTKPFDTEHLRSAVRLALERRQLRLENVRYQQQLEEKNQQLQEAQEKLRRRATGLQQELARESAALKETESRYRDLFNLANDAIFTVECRSGRILDVNLQAQVLMGYNRDELLQMNIEHLHTEEQRQRLKDFFDHIRQTGTGMVDDHSFQTRGGETIIVSVSCSILRVEGTEVVNLLCRDVTRMREIEAELVRYTHELERSCEEKTRNLLSSQAQLVQAEKMAALGSLVAGVAHEINTPLGSINGNNDILTLAFQKVQQHLQNKQSAAQAGTDEELNEVLSIVEDAIRTNRLASDRIVKIVRSLRNFARLDEAERKKADIHEGIESTLTLVAHELKRRIEVVKEFGQVREIECFPNQLNQVFMNMLVNASQAIEGEGRIRIRTWEQDDAIHVAIQDNGKGIPPELQTKIFDPGFTTKKVGLGTGLGLSICLRIVQDHGGRIDVDSRVGEGTTFTIVLPFQGKEERKANV